MVETLPELLQRVLRDKFHGVKSAMAAAIGMTPSPFGKVVDGASTYFGPEACLRLAKVTGEPASEVLRVAGKGELADLIEELYGHQTISPQDRQLLDRWHSLSPSRREVVRTLMNELLPPEALTARKGRQPQEKQAARKTA